ncbi:hypothetical protein BH10ACT1_BH10ACT1_20500 [soil metagenome]
MSSARHRRSTALACCALLLAPLTAACSSDSDADPERTTSTTEAPGGDGTTTTAGPDETTSTVPAVRTTTTVTEDPVPSGDEQAYVDALITSFVADGNRDLPLVRDEAECVAPRWVEAIGVDRFAAAGVEPGDITVGAEEVDSYFDVIDGLGDPETAEALVDSFADCDIDLTALVADLIADQGEATAAQRTCFIEAVPDGALEQSLARALDGDEATEAEFDAQVDAAAEKCFA